MTTSQPGTQTNPSPRATRRARARALFLSADFFVGFPLGAALGAITAAFPSAVSDVPTILMAVAAIAAGLAALAIATMTVLLGSFGPAYRALLARVPGGVTGTLVPYRQVVSIAIAASVSGFVVALVWPGLTGAWWWLTATAAGVPFALFCWALLGCVQVVNQLAAHIQANELAEDLAQRTEAARSRRSSNSA